MTKINIRNENFSLYSHLIKLTVPFGSNVASRATEYGPPIFSFTYSHYLASHVADNKCELVT